MERSSIPAVRAGKCLFMSIRFLLVAVAYVALAIATLNLQQMDRAEKEDFALDCYGGATYNASENAELRNIYRKRIRYIANCIASPGVGLMGGLLAIAISRNSRHGLDEDADS